MAVSNGYYVSKVEVGVAAMGLLLMDFHCTK